MSRKESADTDRDKDYVTDEADGVRGGSHATRASGSARGHACVEDERGARTFHWLYSLQVNFSSSTEHIPILYFRPILKADAPVCLASW